MRDIKFRKSLAFVGNFQPEWSTENDVRRAFEYLNWEVITLQENLVTWQQVREAAFSSDLLLWVGTWDEAQPLKESIDTIRQCGMRGIPTATLHLDIFFESDRGDRKWWLAPMFQTAHVFSADGSHQKQWELLGVNHHWLKPGVRHDAAHFGTYREEYACDVGFAGSNGHGYHVAAWPYRKQLVDELRSMCVRNGWSWRNPGGDDPKIERGEDMNDFYESVKVTIGDSLCLNKESTLYCSDRAFEGPARGGLLIMPQLDFLQEDYQGHLPMYKWGDFTDLEEKIRYYLTHDEENRLVRKQTQSIAAEKHTYVQRVEELLETVGFKEEQ